MKKILIIFAIIAVMIGVLFLVSLASIFYLKDSDIFGFKKLLQSSETPYIEGVVLDALSLKPLENVLVQLELTLYDKNNPPGFDYTPTVTRRIDVNTDKAGRFIFQKKSQDTQIKTLNLIARYVQTIEGRRNYSASTFYGLRFNDNGLDFNNNKFSNFFINPASLEVLIYLIPEFNNKDDIIKFCGQIKDDGIKRLCFDNNAYVISVEDLDCELFDLDDPIDGGKAYIASIRKDDCLIKVAFDKKDPKLCEELYNMSYNAASCYHGLAEILNDPQLCERIEKLDGFGYGSRSGCFKYFAENRKDKSYCDFLKCENDFCRNQYNYCIDSF